MGKSKEFENILTECLDRLMKGEDIESCLARYPEHAVELEPLLKTALEARTAAAVKPRAEFRQRAGYEFQKAISEMPSKTTRGSFRWQLRWVVPVAVVLVLLSGGAGTVVAATNSLPDSPLYQVKLATEAIQLAFTFSEQGKAELYARFVDYRVEEIVRMAEEGKLEQVEQATERMNNQLLAIANLQFNGGTTTEKGMFALEAPPVGTQSPSTTVPAPTLAIPAPTTSTPPERDTASSEYNDMLSDIEKLKQLLREKYEQNLQILLEQLEKAPETLKPALQEAIDVLQTGYELALASLG